MKALKPFIPIEKIDRLILLIRGHKVMLDSDLAELYGVKTKELNQAVSRNIDRFPRDFAFQLKREDIRILKSQIVTSSGWGGRRKPPFVFTELGIAMLSSVLKSKRAVAVNIEIMRSFVKLRQLLSSHKELATKLESLEKKYDLQFKSVFEAIRHIMAPPQPLQIEEKKVKIGFKVTEDRLTPRARPRQGL